MRTIIAGSRDIDDYGLLQKVIEESGIPITVVLSGRAKGIDKLGERWAFENDIPVECYPAKWDDLSHPEAVIKENEYGKYDAMAGIRRNERMVKHADALIAVIKDSSDGTSNVIEFARKYHKKCHIHEVE